MKKYILLTVLISFGMLYQMKAQETSVFLDNENRLEVIDRELAKKIQIFPEYKEIEEIRLYKSAENVYFLEIVHKTDGKRQKARLQMNQSEVDELRNKITSEILTKSSSTYLDQEGRTELLVGSALLSLGYWGWCVPTILEIENGASFTGTYFLTAGVGFLIPYLVTKNSNITKGMSKFAISGGALGLGHGALGALFIGGNDVSSQGVFGGMLLVSITELMVNYNIAKSNKFSAGKSSVISGYSVWGSILGVSLSGLLDFFEHKSPSAFAGTTLLTSGFGYVAGAWISNTQDFTEGDASIMFGSGILGAALPVSMLVLAEHDEYKTYLGLLALGSIGGLWLGAELVKGYDFSSSNGLYNSLAMGGGALIGTGIGLLISSGDNDSYRLIPLLATIGATAGFGFSYSAFRDDARLSKDLNNLKIEFNPAGLAIGSLLKTHQPISIPFLNVQYKF